MVEPKGRRIDERLRAATETLKGFPNPRLDAEWLMAYALAADRTQLYLEPERKLKVDELQRFDAALSARSKGKPLAYITGKTEFWSLPLAISEDVLVPRPDTEILVSHALEIIDRIDARRVMDLGTGSGAIAAALAHERPSLNVIAIDRSPQALAVAQSNFRALGLDRIQCLCGDWLSPCGKDSVDVIVCNPPYVDALDTDSYEASLSFEPALALFADNQGLAAIRCVAERAKETLRAGGALLLEHGHKQSDSVVKLLSEFGYVNTGTVLDLGGFPRVSFGFSP